MSDKLYIFDAMNFAFRSYYAIKAGLTDQHGRPTNAVFGFARMLVKLLREHEPTHVAVVFDAPGDTFRTETYAEYKATRRETPQDLLDQFPIIDELMEAMNLPRFSIAGVEADDVMGSLAVLAAREQVDCVLVSGDKDLLQLVNGHVRVFDPAKGDNGLWYDADAVRERFGVGPENVVDALALIGDTADNVPGVRGIGDKTAKKLLEQYQSLDGLYENIDALKGKQKERLLEDKEQAYFSRELVTIKTDVPIERSVESLRREPPERERLVQVLQGLSFHALLDELYGDNDPLEVEPEYTLVLTRQHLDDVCAAMRAAGYFAIDTETDSLDAIRARLVGVSLAAEPNVAYYIPVDHALESYAAASGAEGGTEFSAAEAIDALRGIVEDAALGKVGHNIKYDLNVLAGAGLALRGIQQDTLVASYLTDPGKLRHNLNDLSLQYLRRRLTPISALIGKGAKALTFDQVPIDQAAHYACEDADVTLQLDALFRPMLHERQLEALWADVERPLLDVLARMERRGIALDTEHFEALREEVTTRLATLEHEIVELAGVPFNVNSPKQLQGVLFDTLGLKPVRKTKTGYSTDVDVLEQLALEHPLPEKLLEYRMLEKLRGTYVAALPKLVNPDTGRVHSSFNQAVAATGRLSSSDPNLQNIPIRTELGRRIREGFVPARGWRLISADYSQIELRILAHLSGDEALCAAFAAGADIHRDTAARVFKVAAEDVQPEMRRQAKAVNFGVVYGISAFGLARNLGIARGEAQAFIDAYFATYPGVRRWLDATVEQAREQGYVTTLLGRRRYLPELRSADVATRRGAERAAINTPVQGSAADIIKLAMVRLDQALHTATGAAGEAALLLQVHDELVVEAPAAAAEEVASMMQTQMEQAVSLDIHLKVDVGIGDNWAEAH